MVSRYFQSSSEFKLIIQNNSASDVYLFQSSSEFKERKVIYKVYTTNFQSSSEFKYFFII